MKTLRNIALTLLALMPFASWSVETTKLDDLTVMALGAVDGRAVIKTPDGKMQVLKVGDTIPGTQAVVSQVLNDKLIVEETIAAKDKPAAKQTVWISKAAKPGEKSSVQRFDSEAPASPVVAVKVMKQVAEQPAPKSAAPKKK